MYVEERVCTVEARKVRAMPRRQGAKPYEAHSLWRKSVTLVLIYLDNLFLNVLTLYILRVILIILNFRKYSVLLIRRIISI